MEFSKCVQLKRSLNKIDQRKYQIAIALIFISLTPTVNYLLLTKNPRQNRMFYGDPDYLDNGNIMVCGGDILDSFEIIDRIENNRQYIPKGQRNNYVAELNRNGELIWAVQGFDFPHEVLQLPSGELLVADTLNDRVVQVNYPNYFHVWEWSPEMINWTDVNPTWGPDHYYNNNEGNFDWSHLNDVDFKSYENWDALLISLRNFDLVVEINFTAARSHTPQASDIVWYYGDYQNYTLLNHQHNPDYLSNGNIVIADSENNRIVEINKTTKEIEWSYNKGLKWCRDANELPLNVSLPGMGVGRESFLVSDVDRIFVVDKQTKNIVWQFEQEILQAYSTEYNAATQKVLVDCSFLGKIIEVDFNSKEIVWEHGKSILRQMWFFNGTILAAQFGFWGLVSHLKASKQEKGKNKRRAFIVLRSALWILCTLIIVALIFHMFFLRIVLWDFVSTQDIG